MKNITTVGVDLAKDVIQVCVVTRRKVISNTEMTPQEFRCFLVKMKSCIIVFEACGTSNYWKQVSISKGHDARLISAKLVSQIRQNQKTDKNDALAIVQASQSASIGVTPIQYSSGGQIKLGGIGRRVKNALVRSNLISVAMSVVQQVSQREPRTTKEKWLKALIERRGNKCAAVASANKTVRTAFAMLRDGTEYHAQALTD